MSNKQYKVETKFQEHDGLSLVASGLRDIANRLDSGEFEYRAGNINVRIDYPLGDVKLRLLEQVFIEADLVLTAKGK